MTRKKWPDLWGTQASAVGSERSHGHGNGLGTPAERPEATPGGDPRRNAAGEARFPQGTPPWQSPPKPPEPPPAPPDPAKIAALLARLRQESPEVVAAALKVLERERSRP